MAGEVMGEFVAVAPGKFMKSPELETAREILQTGYFLYIRCDHKKGCGLDGIHIRPSKALHELPERCPHCGKKDLYWCWIDRWLFENSLASKVAPLGSGDKL